jgi:NAD(P)-dependent dehydrogenase (short-subunit alcohol dehydrogenase family)
MGEFVQVVAKWRSSIVTLAGCDTEKLRKKAEAITASNPKILVRQLEFDLESLGKVKEAAKALNSWTDVPVVDVFVHSAVIMAVNYAATVDGFEQQFAVNHLATFFFTDLIMDKILVSKESQIVIAGSSVHR